MKLLLTSAGLKTEALKQAFLDLTPKPASELRVAYIPTAANEAVEDKAWLIDNLVELRDMHFAFLDIVDIAVFTPDQAKSRLQDMDVIVFGGGVTKYLVDTIRRAELDVELLEWAATKVFVGISAGSVMMGPVINPQSDRGLNWVDFIVVPHKDSPYTGRTAEQVESFSVNSGKVVYWLGDEAAVLVQGEHVEVIGADYQIFEDKE